jgi:FAD/FMN-containing dehydrogenase
MPQTIGTVDLDALRGALQGSVLIRGAPGHAEAAALYNLRFPARPLMVVRPTSQADVSQALQTAVRQRIPWFEVGRPLLHRCVDYAGDADRHVRAGRRGA